MKNRLFAIVFFCTLHLVASSQTSSVWKGGTPGQPAEWNCPTNWKENRVPDEYAQVSIPSDILFYPIIKHDVPSIDALLVTGGAQLTIKQGASLMILGETGRFNVLTAQGRIINHGKLLVPAWDLVPPPQKQMVEGNAIVQL